MLSTLFIWNNVLKQIFAILNSLYFLFVYGTLLQLQLTLLSFIPVICCLVAFFIGLIFVQRSGNYFVTMFDDYSATLPLLIVVILENIAVTRIYGIDK